MAAPIVKLGLLGDRVTTRLSNQLKRETLRQLPAAITDFLSRIKIEITVYVPGGTLTKVLDPVDLTSADIKVFSYVQNVDHRSIGGRVESNSVLFGIEDLPLEMADDWGDLICKARIRYAADGKTPESVVVRFMGAYTHTKIYLDGRLVYESEKRPDGKYYTDWYYSERI
ncbi:MAG: hypothetical protein QXN21_04100 [Candidatus Bathyarchaeia archaeon]